MSLSRKALMILTSKACDIQSGQSFVWTSQAPRACMQDCFLLFGTTQLSKTKAWCAEFEVLMKGEFEMSAMGEMTFFLGLQVKQLPDGTFISQDRYVKDMLTKFDMESVRTATTPYEAAKTKLKDETDPPVNVHFACSRHQVTPLTSHLNAVKKIFKYLKGQPKLGLWYPKDSPFQLEAYSDSDYAGSHGDRKSTTGGCQFLGRRLISWQCKKQTIVATSSTEARRVDMVLDSAGSTMFLLVVIISAGCFISAGSYGLCCWVRVHAGGHTSAGGFISADKGIITNEPASPPTPPAQTVIFEVPLVFGPAPRPAGYVDPDTIDQIIYGPHPRPYDFVDPALEEPMTPFLVDGPDDAPTPTADAAGRAEDPALLTSLSAKIDRCMGRIDSLETELGTSKKVMGGAILTLVSRVKKLERTVKQLRTARNYLVWHMKLWSRSSYVPYKDMEERRGGGVSISPFADVLSPKPSKKNLLEQASERLVQRLRAEDLAQEYMPNVSEERAKELDELMMRMTETDWLNLMMQVGSNPALARGVIGAQIHNGYYSTLTAFQGDVYLNKQLIGEYENICRRLEKDAFFILLGSAPPLSGSAAPTSAGGVFGVPDSTVSTSAAMDSAGSHRESGVSPFTDSADSSSPSPVSTDHISVDVLFASTLEGITEFFLDSDEDEQIGMSRVAADPDSDDEVLAEMIEDFFSSESESDDDMENYIPPLPYGAFKDWEIMWCWFGPLEGCQSGLQSFHSDDVEIFVRNMMNGLCAAGSCIPRALFIVLDLTNGKTVYMTEFKWLSGTYECIASVPISSAFLADNVPVAVQVAFLLIYVSAWSVKQIILSTNSGQIGVLPNHAPIATVVDIGILRICLYDQWLTMALMGGFARIGNNDITVLVNDAEKSGDIDPQRSSQILEIVEAALRKDEGKEKNI
ncbi:putative ribonuclease H-like domain-containing protein [Tanacetum coccineum]|uniref:Ribonuclease H-like domain-containing protein n=1 Tax=Tanacetum coccineum TaxID=301880 RepID=A0ABQ4XGM1_9ASTR